MLTNVSILQIERELILSSDKASSKIPLMHESRTPSGIRRAGGIPLLSRQPASIAPDHPPKQSHAWVSIRSLHSNRVKVQLIEPFNKRIDTFLTVHQTNCFAFDRSSNVLASIRSKRVMQLHSGAHICARVCDLNVDIFEIWVSHAAHQHHQQ